MPDLKRAQKCDATSRWPVQSFNGPTSEAEGLERESVRDGFLSVQDSLCVDKSEARPAKHQALQSK